MPQSKEFGKAYMVLTADNWHKSEWRVMELEKRSAEIRLKNKILTGIKNSIFNFLNTNKIMMHVLIIITLFVIRRLNLYFYSKSVFNCP